MNRFWRLLHTHFVPSHHNAYRPHLLRRGYLTFFLALALCAETLLVGSLVVRESGNSFLAAVIQSEIIALTNTERAQNKVSELKENALLDRSAQAKADDMAAKNYFAHVGPDGKEPWRWIEEAGYDYQYAGENLAVRFVDSGDVVAGWMASPTHRANIVKPTYSEVGVGIAQGLYKGEPATYVVQYFGTPATVVGTPAPAAQPVASAPTSAPVPVETVLGAETVAPAPATFSDSLARNVGKAISEPRATTAWILGAIITLLMLALFFTFFHHVQIQARDLLLPGTLVAGIALFLLFVNSNMLPDVIPDNQAASVVNAIPR